MRTLEERIPREQEVLRKALGTFDAGLRVALPGIIQAFDSSKQTVTVRCAIRETIKVNNVPTDMDIPLLVDVPVVLFRAGGYMLTLPIAEGDECLVVFSDLCIDAWWQNGGVQNRMSRRRHDLSDGFAIPGPWSQPNVIANYSTSAAELRTEDGATKVSISGSTINITTAGTINIGSGDVKINSKVFLTHQHSGVQTGGGTTGGVV
jgi:hypothetical protein